MRHNDQEVLEQAVSVLAKFTAFSVERFHKIAELLLIKEHRTTVDEADTLVLLAHIFSNQTGILANDYCHALKVFSETSGKPNDVNGSITTIYMKVRKHYISCIVLIICMYVRNKTLLFGRLQKQVHIFKMLSDC